MSRPHNYTHIPYFTSPNKLTSLKNSNSKKINKQDNQSTPSLTKISFHVHRLELSILSSPDDPISIFLSNYKRIRGGIPKKDKNYKRFDEFIHPNQSKFRILSNPNRSFIPRFKLTCSQAFPILRPLHSFFSDNNIFYSLLYAEFSYDFYTGTPDLLWNWFRNHLYVKWMNYRTYLIQDGGKTLYFAPNRTGPKNMIIYIDYKHDPPRFVKFELRVYGRQKFRSLGILTLPDLLPRKYQYADLFRYFNFYEIDWEKLNRKLRGPKAKGIVPALYRDKGLQAVMMWLRNNNYKDITRYLLPMPFGAGLKLGFEKGKALLWFSPYAKK